MVLVFIIFVISLTSATYDVRDESAFKITWSVDRSLSEAERKSVQLSTTHGEKYHCFLPLIASTEYKVTDSPNSTADLFEAMKKLFKSHICYTRSETYWNYELCHGTHIRQFHEELLPDKSSKTQEYFLGYFSDPDYPQFETNSRQPPTILLGESMYPYLLVNFTNGTPCDLTNFYRMSSVLYVCIEEEEGRIIQVSEVESCHYQLVFATRHLCGHPSFKLPKKSAASVPCLPHGTSPQKPTILTEFEKEQRQLTNFGASSVAALFDNLGFSNIKVETERKNNMIVYRIRTDTSSGSNSEPSGPPLTPGSRDSSTEAQQHQPSSSPASMDRSSLDSLARMRIKMFEGADPASVHEANREQLRAFLKSQFCLVGQTAGWWTHEICFKRNVTQYHSEKQGERSQVVLLGRWDPEAHSAWLSQQSTLDRPKAGTTFN
ncbi:unnamed protein product [Dicrocoelium dendriticum]|nr:unnamed protein product [Dicrocoelium dendriticum]